MSATPPATLTVAPTPFAERLKGALVQELGAHTLREAGGDAVVRLTGTDRALDLRVTRPGGAVLLSRQIHIRKDGLRPALRIAVLLVVEVQARLSQAQDDPAPAANPVPKTRPAPRPPETDPDSPPEGATRLPPSGPQVSLPWHGLISWLAPWTRLEPAAPSPDPSAALSPGEPASLPPGEPASLPPDPSAAPLASATSSTSSAARPRFEAPQPILTTPQGEPRPAVSAAPRLWLAVAGTASWWARPGTPMLGLTVAARYDLQPFLLGLRGGVGGLCCHLAQSSQTSPTQTRIEADPLQVWGLAELALPVFEVGDFVLAPVVGAGLEWTRVRATATAFVGAPVTESRSAVGALVRVGLGASFRLSAHLGLDLGLGLLLRSPRLAVRLPEPFSMESADLDVGGLAPWLHFGGRFAPF